MTKNRDFKRLVRARMQKTGESYTTARSHLVSTDPQTPQVPPERYAEIAGMSDEAVKAETGCDWAGWVAALDRAGAHQWSHPDIAKYVAETWSTTGWWAQAVTVGYERLKGIRQVGQQSDGSFNANKSRTYPVPIERLFEAFDDETARRAWLGDLDLTVRTSRPNKSIRITWPDETSVEAYFTARSAVKSSVAIQHRKLASQADVARAKSFWDERLSALGETLSA